MTAYVEKTKLQDERQIAATNILGDSSEKIIDRDKELLSVNDKGHLIKRNEQYDKLITLYVDRIAIQEKSNKKIKLAIVFTVLLILLSITAAFTKFMAYDIKEVTNFSAAAVALSGTFTFIAALLTLPKMIVQYLFNVEEEANMVNVIRNIQDYDAAIRSKWG